MASVLHHLLPLVIVLLVLAASAADAATFTVTNNCPYTVWAAAVPGGGRQLDNGQTWSIDVPAGTTGGRVWARTGCSFDGSGSGRCETGDCGGVLQCAQYGQPPNTLAEYGLNQFDGLDFFDISLVDGFSAHGLPPRRRRRRRRVPQGRAAVRRRRHGAVPRRAAGPRRLRQPVHRVQDRRVLLHGVGGRQLRAHRLLQVLQGAVPGRLQLPQGRRHQHLHLPRRHKLQRRLLPMMSVGARSS